MQTTPLNSHQNLASNGFPGSDNPGLRRWRWLQRLFIASALLFSYLGVPPAFQDRSVAVTVMPVLLFYVALLVGHECGNISFDEGKILLRFPFHTREYDKSRVTVHGVALPLGEAVVLLREPGRWPCLAKVSSVEMQKLGSAVEVQPMGYAAQLAVVLATWGVLIPTVFAFIDLL